MFHMSQWLWIREIQQRHNVITEFLYLQVFYCKIGMKLCILLQSNLIAEFVCCTFSLVVMPKSAKYCTAAGCLKTSGTKSYLKYHRFPVDHERLLYSQLTSFGCLVNLLIYVACCCIFQYCEEFNFHLQGSHLPGHLDKSENSKSVTAMLVT